jgi:uncharacterized protein (DUF302 family)
LILTWIHSEYDGQGPGRTSAAKKVLTVDPRVAYCLPCKIVLHEKDGMAIIGMIHSTSMIIEMYNLDLDAIALQIEEKLINVMDSMKG